MAFSKKVKAPPKTIGSRSLSDIADRKAGVPDKDIERAISDIKTKFGDESIMMLGAQPKVDVNAIPTGSIGIDWALGIGGLPRGRIIEIFGPESSGKTTLSLHVIAEAQKKGGICANRIVLRAEDRYGRTRESVIEVMYEPPAISASAIASPTSPVSTSTVAQ